MEEVPQAVKIPSTEEQKTPKEEVVEPKEKVISQTQIEVEQKQEKTLVESLSKEELQIAQEEMKDSVPMEFEPKETKTNIGLFLRNQVVKLASGFKISERMKRITGKMRMGALLGTGVFVLWSGTSIKDGKTSYVLPDNVDGKISSISNESLEKNKLEQSKKTLDLETYNKLPEDAKNIYLYASANIIDSVYVIADKPTATMYVIGKDKKITASFPIILGKTKGEQPNMADPDSDFAGPHATTPAGKYKIGRDSIESSDFIEYQGRVFSVYGTKRMGIHMTYPEEYAIRTAALNTPTPDDNRMSWGCVNVDKAFFDKYLSAISNNTTLFITPDNTNLTLNPKTGKIENQSLTQLKSNTSNHYKINV